MVTVFGFKIWVVWDPNSGLPIAMRFATIETHDVICGKTVLKPRGVPDKITLEDILSKHGALLE